MTSAHPTLSGAFPGAFPWAEKICRIANPLHWDSDTEQAMIRACQEMALFHQKNNPEIAKLYQRHHFDPRELKGEDDFAKIPPLGVTAMKHFLLLSLPEQECVLQLTSSGTKGQKTQIWFDRASLDRCQAMLEEYWRQDGFISHEKQNYLIFGYDPKDANNLGTAFADDNQMRFAPKAQVAYALKMQNGEWVFDKANTLKALLTFSDSPFATRIFGMPAFIFEFLQFMKEQKQAVVLPLKSLLMTGGGWKASEDKKITKEDFRSLTTQLLGIPADLIRDGYGMAEHCAPYNECPSHRFHVPVYTRVLVRDPVTLRVLPPGETGILELITPFNAMMPNLALLTTDLGRIDPQTCDCGYRSPTFTLLGRAGLSKHKGCALHADEIVKRRSL